MEPISQVVLRNRNRWGDGPVLLVDMPADGLESALREAGLALRASNQEFGTYKALSARGTAAEFAPAPRAERGEALIVLRLPREKERFAMVLHALAASMDSDARLWVVGEKRAGIKSAGRLLEQRFASVDRLDNARHCSLLEARAPRACPPFRLDDLGATLSVDAGASRLRLCSLPGVFAHRRVDGGTALLLDALEDCAVHGRVLDFACGNGIVGIGLLRAHPGVQLTLLDTSALALEAARRSLALNDGTARVLASDGLGELDGRFDWIVSNPPFHRGVDNDLDIAADFFRRAGTFLEADGRIVVVFNRHLPYERWAREHFRSVRRLAQNREYTVLQASRNA
ncbi:MAG: methyltransferase [Xanthomonadales bacterium]